MADAHRQLEVMVLPFKRLMRVPPEYGFVSHTAHEPRQCVVEAPLHADTGISIVHWSEEVVGRDDLSHRRPSQGFGGKSVKPFTIERAI
ncbi:hypothetical protein HYR99_22550, partial [Candidatus Poribacteria bacterium]|nr:hypothetical protein [Candidatus Poribacteria bacterium]